MSIESTKSVTTVSQTMSSSRTNAETAKATQSAGSSVETVSTQVTLSDAKKALYQSQPADIDMQRVEQIKQDIREGKLTIDSSKIADALISEALELIGQDKM